MSDEKELVLKISKLKKSLNKLQEYKGELFGKLQTILREIRMLKNKQNPELEEDKKAARSLKVIEEKTNEIEMLLDSSYKREEREQTRYYKVNLYRILNFGILNVESDDVSLSVTIKGRLFEILHELVKKYCDDSKRDIPVEFRGYVNRKKLEKKLYGKYIGRNRLNSHITRIRSILMEKGLTDTSFIKSPDEFVRLNIKSDDVTITPIITD